MDHSVNLFAAATLETQDAVADDFIENVAILASYDIESGVVLENIGTLTVEGITAFGNGTTAGCKFIDELKEESRQTEEQCRALTERLLRPASA